MGGFSDKSNQDMEDLLRGGAFSNFSHRDALRKRLFDKNKSMLLSIEDLEGVTGGLSIENLGGVTGGRMVKTSEFEEWPNDPPYL